MDVLNITKISLCWELFQQGIPQTHIAKQLLIIFKDFNLKTSDAIILGTAIMNKATLITWDKKLVKEAKKLANVQTPTTFLSKTVR